jgi:hypothetical protein
MMLKYPYFSANFDSKNQKFSIFLKNFLFPTTKRLTYPEPRKTALIFDSKTQVPLIIEADVFYLPPFLECEAF